MPITSTPILEVIRFLTSCLTLVFDSTALVIPLPLHHTMDNLHVKDKVSITQHVLFTAVGNLVRSALVNTDLYPNSHTLRYSSSLFALRDLETNWGSSVGGTRFLFFSLLQFVDGLFRIG